MIVKCPHCGGALEFNPQSGKMECQFCGSTYESESDIVYENNENIECNIYTCTSCGAELMVNGVESSSFCAYCGQPTVVFSRISKEMKPDYIIPFRLTREQAFQNVREKFGKGAMVPNEIKNFQIEKMRGIYIPYFIYDMNYRDKQGLERRGGRNTPTVYYIREAECEFKGILHDASKQLKDESANYLEPYNLSELIPFQPQYLSGFYADKYDLNQQEIIECGVKRAKEFFDAELIKRIGNPGVSIKCCNPAYKIQRIQYALLPAWFITFRYKDEPYTILVNGQTGKVVGTVPFDKGKIWKTFLLSWLGFAALLIPIAPLLGGHFGMIIGLSLCMKAYSDFKKIRKTMEMTKSQSTMKYVKERQDKI